MMSLFKGPMRQHIQGFKDLTDHSDIQEVKAGKEVYIPLVAGAAKNFEMFVKDGDFVKKGDKLMAFDIQYIKEHAKSEACIVVFTGLTEEEEVVMKRSGHVNAQEEIAEIVSC